MIHTRMLHQSFTASLRKVIKTGTKTQTDDKLLFRGNYSSSDLAMVILEEGTHFSTMPMYWRSYTVHDAYIKIITKHCWYLLVGTAGAWGVWGGHMLLQLLLTVGLPQG